MPLSSQHLVVPSAVADDRITVRPVDTRVEHFFTVDVEEHFQVSAFESVIPPETWDSHPSRVERNVDRVLELLDGAGASATFFTLGWVAARHPSMVRRIVDCGHEVASHGLSHTRVHHLAPAGFRDEVRRSKRLLEDAAGAAVVGFRAPNFSILAGSEWAFDVLLEEGYRYDSSRFPIRRAGYGTPNAPTNVHVVRRASGSLLEFPLATLDLFGARIPAAGAAYLRHFPYDLVRAAFRQFERNQRPGVFYVHPWELDPEQPRIAAPVIARARHYVGLGRTARRIERLLREFRFTSIQSRLNVLAQSPELCIT